MKYLVLLCLVSLAFVSCDSAIENAESKQVSVQTENGPSNGVKTDPAPPKKEKPAKKND